jgi:hypothetical protein
MGGGKYWSRPMADAANSSAIFEEMDVHHGLRQGCRHRRDAAEEERERLRKELSLRSNTANTPTPPSANNVPTHPVDVHP